MKRILMLLLTAAAPVLLGGCVNGRFEHRGADRSERVTVHSSGDYDVSHRRDYESEAERRLAQYQDNWKHLGRQAKDKTGNYGRDWVDLDRRMSGNLDKAAHDLNRLRKSGDNEWDEFRNDWEDLMDGIGDQFEDMERRIRH